MQAASVLVDENDCVESAAMPLSSVERFQPNHPKHTKWYSQCVFHSPVVFLVTVRRLHLITGLFSHSEWLLLKHVFPAGRKKTLAIIGYEQTIFGRRLLSIISLTVSRYPIEFSFSNTASAALLPRAVAFVCVQTIMVMVKASLPDREIAISCYFHLKRVFSLPFITRPIAFYSNWTKSLNSIMLIDCGSSLLLNKYILPLYRSVCVCI